MLAETVTLNDPRLATMMLKAIRGMTCRAVALLPSPGTPLSACGLIERRNAGPGSYRIARARLD